MRTVSGILREWFQIIMRTVSDSYEIGFRFLRERFQILVFTYYVFIADRKNVEYGD